MQISGKDTESFDCPHCEASPGSHRLFNAVKKIPTMSVSRFSIGMESRSYVTQVEYRHLIYRCNNCNNHIYMFLREAARLNIGDHVSPSYVQIPAEVVMQFPQSSIIDRNGNSIPSDVRIATAEAEKCLFAGAYNACGVMARRAVHAICDSKQAPAGYRLFNRVESLYKMGLVSADARAAADDLKDAGKKGAALEWEVLNKQEAYAAIALLYQLISHLYQKSPVQMSESKTQHRS